MRRTGAVVCQNLGAADSPRRALLHYKIDPVIDARLQGKYHHTNNWEVPELVRILNGFGFMVDLVDRSNRKWMPEDRYDLLISNASGNSGKLFPVYAARMPRALKIFYALGPEVGDANARVLDRYTYLTERTGQELSAMRVMESVDIGACMAVSDAIVCLDDNGYSTGTYRDYPLPIHRIAPSASPRATFDPRWMTSRSRSTFLAFTGDGFIAKGVDLLVEAFAQIPDARLVIAGPNSDTAFWKLFGERIRQAGNIEYEGFLQVGGDRYRQLMARCSWVILPTAAEGLCTSITTTMRSGLVPISTFESGVALDGCGYRLVSDPRQLIEDIRTAVTQLAHASDDEYARRVGATLVKAQDYSQAAFTQSWCTALAAVLNANGALAQSRFA